MTFRIVPCQGIVCCVVIARQRDSASLSQRVIAEIVGADQAPVCRDIAASDANASEGDGPKPPITGVNGKTSTARGV
jgi:hypothetical protein